jgi:hypothetical protein
VCGSPIFRVKLQILPPPLLHPPPGPRLHTAPRLPSVRFVPPSHPSSHQFPNPTSPLPISPSSITALPPRPLRLRGSLPPTSKNLAHLASWRFTSPHLTSPNLRPPPSALRPPPSALRTPHSALRPPPSALRTPHSALRTPHSALENGYRRKRRPPRKNHPSFRHSLSPFLIAAMLLELRASRPQQHPEQPSQADKDSKPHSDSEYLFPETVSS